ncbi:non-ribosomal peptide synthetase [Flavobacterium sp. N502540]|uniref:non-ribosomal peptide synthetase n=1 Tax=Flavobacterium sp. N502540 TaxID=2986838 RepID=UPI0022258B30|nr:non-ribosomal peptide synthetase [Flavobacterium sp. N502540]
MKLLLKKLKQVNIKINLLDNGNIDIQCPKGVMTEELLNEIKSHKEELIEFLTLNKKNVKQVFIPKASENTDYVLSSSQRRLWLLSQLEGGNTAYNMPSVFHLEGNLDVISLEKAFNHLIERHESLRTVFKETELGELRQIILELEESKFQLQYVDLSEKPISESAIKDLVQKELDYSFDLSFDSLLRAKLLKISQNSYVFICMMHHIISDGWSSEIMSKELFTLYEAYVNQKSSPLSELRLQYKDYAVWQQSQLKGADIELDKTYWLQQFQEEIPNLDLPTRQTRPAIKTYNGKAIQKKYDKSALKKFTALCQSQDCTSFMGFVALTKLLLYRYTNQNDIVIGSPVAGRENFDLQDQIGFYVNTLALRTQFRKTDSFKELLSNIKEVTLGAYEHQSFPFDELVEILPLKRDLSRNPLFDVMVRSHEESLLQNETQRLAEIEIKNYKSGEVNFSKFDLEFIFNEAEEGLVVTIIFNNDIYSQEFGNQILNHLEVLLNNVVLNPEIAIDRVDYLDKTEKKRLLNDFNTVDFNFSTDKTVIDLFEEQVKATPDNFAVIFEDSKLTYKELEEQSNQFAAYLLESYGIKPDDLVGIKLEKSEKLIVAILGVLKSGGAYVPIDPHYPENRIEFIEKDSNCKAVIDQDELEKFNKNKEKYAVEKNDVTIDVHSLVYLIYTSGSTGTPKGIMMEHKSMLNLINFHNEQFKKENVKNVLQFTSISFDVSFQEIFTTLLGGATLFPISETVKKDYEDLSFFIKRNHIDTVFLPTSYFRILMEVNSFYSLLDLNIIKNIIVAGEQLSLSKDALNKISNSNTKLHNHYGPAETHVVTTITLLGDDLVHNPSIGSPISNTQIYILDDSFQPVGLGINGKLYISGFGVARGYLNRPELTEEKFIPNPFVEGTMMYDTGDLGCWLPDGKIEFKGRRDHQVKIRGFRVELEEIENIALQYSEALVQFLVEAVDTAAGKVLVAYFVSDTAIDKSNLRSYLQNQLPDYMVPGFYVKLEALPLTPNGKIDRKALPVVAGEDLIKKEYIAPVGDIQEKLALIWQEVLGIQEIGVTDNFFELGGHSLIVGQVINRIYKQLNKSVTFKTFFSSPTIETLSKELQDQVYQAISKAPEAPSYPLTAAQGRIWILSQLEGGSLAYNMPAAVRLHGDVDLQKMKKCFTAIIASHEILRTRFKTSEEGEVRQHIASSDQTNFEIAEIDFSFEKNQDQVIADYLEQLNNEPFDLEHGPLIRASLLKTASEHYIFFLSMHHIIGDGWSIELLLSEIIKNYNALRADQAINLPVLNIQYKDYAVWLNAEIQQEKHRESENYWLAQFAGEIPVLDLPSFNTRPLLKTYNGTSQTHTFSKAFLERLKTFSNAKEATLFMTLMAGIKILLYRYTGQSDLIIGTPIAGREHPDLENQLGLYLNILAVRTQFDDRNSFENVVNKEKNILLEAYEHQNYPFDVLISKLNLKRDAGRSALFDVLVVLQNQGQLKNLNNDKLNDLEVSQYDLHSNTSKFDISFTFVETEGLDLIIEYNTDIYDAFLITRMFSHFENIMSQSMEQPEIFIEDLDYLLPSEKEQLLVDFNDTKADYPRDKTIIDLFEKQIEASPDSIAVVFEKTKLTYRELNKQANELGHYLREMYSIEADDLVGVKLERSEKMIVVLLGILKSGGAYVPIDINYPEQRISYIQDNSNCKAVIDSAFLENFLAIRERFSDENPVKINKPSHLAYVIYTSGTTGNPKGVMVENRNVVNFLYGMNRSICLGEKDHLLAITSISFDISVLELFWTLTNGIPITIKGDNTSINNFNSFLKDHSEELDFSLFYFSSQEASNDNKYKFLKESAVYADKNNFSAVWLPERHFHEFGGIFPNPSVLGAALSTITENIEIRSGSVVLPLHDVVRVAEEWSVVDNLSDGRVALSIASGWHADDFVLKPEHFRNRHEIMYGQIEELKTLWQGNSIRRKNGLDQEIDFKIYPKPINPKLNIYITSGGNAETFRSAGRIGANILTHLLGQEINDLKENIRIYKQALAENGYDTEEAKISLMLHTYIGSDLEDVRNKSKEPFKAYLKSSVGLIQKLATDLNRDLTKVSDEDLNDLLELAFERYWQSSALLGTKDSCKKILSEIYSIGVTEIACLVDFGIEDETVLKGLEYLSELKDSYRKVEKLDNSTDKPITSLQITPSYLDALLEDYNSDLFLKSLDNIIVGGENFPNELLEKLRARTKSKLYNMYGPTETTIWSTSLTVETDSILNIGKPIQNTQIYILDDHNNLCPIGVKGSLFIGGEGLTRGYYNDEKLTSDKFTLSNNSLQEDKTIYKTGDLARWTADGSIEYLGRSDSQVKINGYRIELGEIESILMQYKEISKAVVIASKNETGNTNLVAYYTSKAAIDQSELREFIRYKLPHYMVPDQFRELKDIPLTPNGKIDRKALPNLKTPVAFEREYIPPGNLRESKLIEIWKNVLGVEDIGIKDNFFDLGGNSLLIIKMLNAVNMEFKTNISVMEGFNLPNISAISAHINSNVKGSSLEDSEANESKVEELYGIMEESYNLLNFEENE